MVDTGKNVGTSGNCEDLVVDEEGERSVASVEDQLRKEMTVYEVWEMQATYQYIDEIHPNQSGILRENSEKIGLGPLRGLLLSQ